MCLTRLEHPWSLHAKEGELEMIGKSHNWIMKVRDAYLVHSVNRTPFSFIFTSTIEEIVVFFFVRWGEHFVLTLTLCVIDVIIFFTYCPWVWTFEIIMNFDLWILMSGLPKANQGPLRRILAFMSKAALESVHKRLATNGSWSNRHVVYYLHKWTLVILGKDLTLTSL